jgi:hypothetical protein
MGINKNASKYVFGALITVLCYLGFGRLEVGRSCISRNFHLGA